MEVKGGKQRFGGAETERTLAGDLQKERAAHEMDFIRQARGGSATSVAQSAIGGFSWVRCCERPMVILRRRTCKTTRRGALLDEERKRCILFGLPFGFSCVT